jgi:diguanylate cyclase (GGDEF)-like protein/PAS domain S-box-containing protein
MNIPRVPAVRGDVVIENQSDNRSGTRVSGRIQVLEQQVDRLQARKEILERQSRDLASRNAELESVYRDYETAVGTANAMTVRAEILELEIRQIFDTSPDAMWIIDGKHRVKRINQALLKLLGTTADKVVGRRCHDIMTISLCHSPQCPLIQFRGGILRMEADTEMLLPTGDPRPSILTASPYFGLDGELIGVVSSFKDITQRKAAEAALQQANRKLARMATVDGLTQIANRRRFDEGLQTEWPRLVRERKPLALIMCDIDFFKNYNDYFGHQMGDDCLWSVAQAIAEAVRRPADIAARYGGEEFAVILPDTPLKGALHVAEAIRCAVTALQIHHPRSTAAAHVTLSLGVAATVPDRNGSIEMLLQAADSALYQAKSEGRNRVKARPVKAVVPSNPV